MALPAPPSSSVFLGLTLAALLLAGPVRADEPTRADPPVDAPAPVDPVTAEVRAHHRRGLELFDEGDYRLALVEFERAHAIGQSYKVLFNIGQVYFQLRSYAKARLAFERYLAEGGDAIGAERRADVEGDLATLKARTAVLTVRVNVEGAEIAIDEVTLGRTPLESTLVDAGTIRVRITRNGYAPRVRDVTLAGGDVQTINVDLVETKPEGGAPIGLPGAAIAAWIGAGALAVGAVGTAIAASSASTKYDTQRLAPIEGSPQQARADLERQRDQVTGLAAATDILAVTTIAVAAVALYLTLRERPKTGSPRARALPRSVFAEF